MTEKAVEKKKLIRIVVDSGIVYTTGTSKLRINDGINFAFVSAEDEIKDGQKSKKQISKFVTCREQLCEMPRSFLHKTDIYQMFPFSKYTLDMTKLRLLIGIRDDKPYKKEHVFSAKRVINMLEEEAGWEKSIITTVKHPAFEDSINFWMLTGPEKWIRVPQMLSLVCLIIRLGCKFGPFNATNMKDLNKTFTGISNGSIKCDSDEQADRSYIGTVKNHIIPLMKSLDKVFSEPSEYYYTSSKNTDGGWTGYGGIDTFCKCSSGNKKLTEAFRTHILKKGE